MITPYTYIERFRHVFADLMPKPPWNLTANIESILLEKMKTLGPDYAIADDVAIHRTATVDSRAILKAPAIVSQQCFIGAHAYLRGGVYLDEKVSIGPGCEIKSSFIFAHSAMAHFNFIGDSIVGSHVNMEAGAIVANHFNERQEKHITVFSDGKSYATGVEKFGALVGDHCKIGANAVLSPGTILTPGTIVNRLQLIDQSRSVE